MYEINYKLQDLVLVLEFRLWRELADYPSLHTQLRQLGDYPSFIVRLSFVYRSFKLEAALGSVGGV